MPPIGSTTVIAPWGVECDDDMQRFAEGQPLTSQLLHLADVPSEASVPAMQPPILGARGPKRMLERCEDGTMIAQMVNDAESESSVPWPEFQLSVDGDGFRVGAQSEGPRVNDQSEDGRVGAQNI